MRIQKSTDYAVRILIYLSENKGELHTAQTIADAVGIGHSYFFKAIKQLRDNGLVKTEQGRHGGFSLGKPAHQISVYDVYLAMEGEMYMNHCLKEEWVCTKPMSNKDACKVRTFLHSLQEDIIIASMMKKRISDLSYSGECDTEKTYPKNRTATGQESQKRFETRA